LSETLLGRGSASSEQRASSVDILIATDSLILLIIREFVAIFHYQLSIVHYQLKKSPPDRRKFLEAADRKTVGPIAVAHANSRNCTAEEVAVATATKRGGRPVVGGYSNIVETTGNAAPAPGSRKVRPLD